MNQRYMAIFTSAAARDAFAEELVSKDGIIDAVVVSLTSCGVVFYAPIHEECALYNWLESDDSCRSYERARTYTIS